MTIDRIAFRSVQLRDFIFESVRNFICESVSKWLVVQTDIDRARDVSVGEFIWSSDI